jgi:hypothetical protein
LPDEFFLCPRLTNLSIEKTKINNVPEIIERLKKSQFSE